MGIIKDMKKVGVSGSLALRLHRYDYSLERAYFITSCVARRDKCLGKIKNGFMCVNQYGAVVWEQWFWLAEKYPYVELGSFVVMPDHFHGILIINRKTPEFGDIEYIEAVKAFDYANCIVNLYELNCGDQGSYAIIETLNEKLENICKSIK